MRRLSRIPTATRNAWRPVLSWTTNGMRKNPFQAADKRRSTPINSVFSIRVHPCSSAANPFSATCLRLARGPETDHAMALKRGPRSRPGVGPQIESVHKEGAAANYAIRAVLRTLRILARRNRVVGAAVPVLAPLHHVSGHVKSA